MEFTSGSVSSESNAPGSWGKLSTSLTFGSGWNTSIGVTGENMDGGAKDDDGTGPPGRRSAKNSTKDEIVAPGKKQNQFNLGSNSIKGQIIVEVCLPGRSVTKPSPKTRFAGSSSCGVVLLPGSYSRPSTFSSPNCDGNERDVPNVDGGSDSSSTGVGQRSGDANSSE